MDNTPQEQLERKIVSWCQEASRVRCPACRTGRSASEQAGRCRKHKGCTIETMNYLRKLFNTPHAMMAITIIVVVYLGWSTVGVVNRNWRLQQKVSKLQAEIEILELENEQLSYDIEYYKTDEYLEKAAKEELGLRAPGEKVIILPQRQQESKIGSVTTDKVPDGLIARAGYNFDQWMFFLFGRDKEK